MKTRNTYRNGKPKALVHQNCDSCQAVIVNGILCHESGCPDAWADRVRSCRWCGEEFLPEAKHQTYCCESCRQADN